MGRECYGSHATSLEPAEPYRQLIDPQIVNINGLDIFELDSSCMEGPMTDISSWLLISSHVP